MKLDNKACLFYVDQFQVMFNRDYKFLTEIKKTLDFKYLNSEVENKEVITPQEKFTINARRIKYLSIYLELKEKYDKSISGKYSYYKMLISTEKESLSKSIDEYPSHINILDSIRNLENQRREIDVFLKEKINANERDLAREIRDIGLLLQEVKKTTKGIEEIASNIDSTTAEIKGLSTKLDESMQSSDCLAKIAFILAIIALVLSIIFAFFDWDYYTKSASKENIEEVKINQDSIKSLLKIQQDSISEQNKTIKELKDLIIEIKTKSTKN